MAQTKKRQEWNSTAKSQKKILDAATEAFSQGGYHGTTIRDISRLAGLHLPSIYHHFQNKENLFRQALLQTHTKINETMRENIDRKKDLENEVLSLYRAIIEYDEANPGHHALVFSLIYSAPGHLRDELVILSGGEFRKLILEAFKRNPPRDRYQEKLSLMVDLFHSFLLDLSAPNVRSDRRVRFKRSLQYILR